jgi:phytoene desaturase
MGSSSVIVIGAGIGGITVAARLAQQGYKVTVIEKNKRPGGRCDRLIRDGHHFDTGPTLFLMPDLFARAFADLGERMGDHLDLRRIDPSYHIHFEDGSTLDLTSDLNTMQTQLEALEPGSFDGYLKYLHEGYRHYVLSMEHLVNRNFCSPAEFYNLKNFVVFFRLKVLKKHFSNVGKYFKDQRLKMAFTFQDMYVGLSPYEAPAIFSLLQYSEMANGVWLPIGGMYRIIETLVEIARKSGVQFMYNSPVEKINVNGQKATGVTLSEGQTIPADIIIPNADLPYVYQDLLPETNDSRYLVRKQFTCSTLMFFWGVDKQFPQLKTHNLFFGSGYRQSFTRIFDDLTLPDEPSIYIHTPVRVDPSLAPKGEDSLTGVVPVGHINPESPQDWTAIQDQARRYVIQRLERIGISDLEKHIKFEVCYAPPDWQRRYNLVKGSTHGLSHSLLQMGYLRPKNRHHRYHNVYFVGASTHPGTGLPTVLISSRLAMERILLDAHIDKLSTPILKRIKTP